ncbi:MAG: hypothetical protein V4443_07865 [Pseudomonadota bacterium]
MQNSSTISENYLAGADASGTSVSGVSWGAILAGAAGAAALTYILIILGFGLGLSAVSPWSSDGASATTMGISTIAWLTFTQIAASGLGGYLAGRLRVKWASVHTDEVYFRDTAHGFLAWAVASLIVAAFLASSVSAILGAGLRAGGSAVSVAAHAISAQSNNGGSSPGSSGDTGNNTFAYFSDMLFRSDQPAADAATDNSARMEARRIFGNITNSPTLSPDDQQYLGRLIARRTGISQQEAERRVQETYSRLSKTLSDAKATATQAADQARKTAAYTALWMFIALLCGAFFASLCATFGGAQRDRTSLRSDSK